MMVEHEFVPRWELPAGYSVRETRGLCCGKGQFRLMREGKMVFDTGRRARREALGRLRNAIRQEFRNAIAREMEEGKGEG